jgi:hypothetical protein
MSQDKENGCDLDHMGSENFCVFTEDAPKQRFTRHLVGKIFLCLHRE